ncbi:MAG TPA: alkaline phosphatase family protein [Gaiellales bacterium]
MGIPRPLRIAIVASGVFTCVAFVVAAISSGATPRKQATRHVHPRPPAAKPASTSVVKTAPAASTGITADQLVALARIKHVIFVTKENRSFDNYFGLYPGADGTSTGRTMAGRTRRLARLLDTNKDLRHDRAAMLHDIHFGQMTGFSSMPHPNFAYTEARPGQLPAYWAYARHYTLGDHMFSSVAAPSLPNHIFTVAAHDGGMVDDRGYSGQWGCDAPASQRVPVYRDGRRSLQYPCFNITSLGQQLSRRLISWRAYGPRLHAQGSGWIGYEAIRGVRKTALWSHIHPNPQLWKDLARNRLPAVSWVVPPYERSEHPPASVCSGEDWTTSLVDRVMRSPYWSSTLIVVTYDESGGFYDHLAPPRVDNLGYGPRVPLLLIGPWVKPGFIDHHTYDFASIDKLIALRYHLPMLSRREANATPITAALQAQTPTPALILPQQPCPKPPKLGAAPAD